MFCSKTRSKAGQAVAEQSAKYFLYVLTSTKETFVGKTEMNEINSWLTKTAQEGKAPTYHNCSDFTPRNKFTRWNEILPSRILGIGTKGISQW